MLGLMQNQQLMISSLIEHASRHHGEGEIVSRRVEGDIHERYFSGDEWYVLDSTGKNINGGDQE